MNIQNDILCPECGKDFGTLPRFHKHFRQYHKKNESKCTSCEKTFNTAYILRQHVTNVHETKKCDICDLDFANSDAYGEALLAAIVHFNSNNLGFV